MADLLIFDSLYIPYPFRNELFYILHIDWYDLIQRLEYQDLLCTKFLVTWHPSFFSDNLTVE